MTNTRRGHGVRRAAGRPLPLKDDEVRKMQLEPVVVDADFAAGDTVNIDAGPLAGFVGKIKKCSDTAQKATVSVVMFGRNTDVEVEYAQLRKINAELPKRRRCARRKNEKHCAPRSFHKWERRKINAARQVRLVKTTLYRRSYG